MPLQSKEVVTLRLVLDCDASPPPPDPLPQKQARESIVDTSKPTSRPPKLISQAVPLPNEVLEQIVGYLDRIDAICFALTSRKAHNVVLARYKRTRLRGVIPPPKLGNGASLVSRSCKGWGQVIRVGARPSHDHHKRYLVDRLAERLWSWAGNQCIFCGWRHLEPQRQDEDSNLHRWSELRWIQDIGDGHHHLCLPRPAKWRNSPFQTAKMDGVAVLQIRHAQTHGTNDPFFFLRHRVRFLSTSKWYLLFRYESGYPECFDMLFKSINLCLLQRELWVRHPPQPQPYMWNRWDRLPLSDELGSLREHRAQRRAAQREREELEEWQYIATCCRAEELRRRDMRVLA